VVILGAGPTGLGAAWRLHELGLDDWVLLEAEAGPGGLASSVVDDRGFTWDLGGHVQFSHYAYYDAVLDRAVGSAWLTHERQSWIWLKGRFVPYPFQSNLHRLDAQDCARAVRGLEDAQANVGPPPRNFAEWIPRTFGDGIADLFLVPYNRKVWGCPLEDMAVGWVGDRVAVVARQLVKGEGFTTLVNYPQTVAWRNDQIHLRDLVRGHRFDPVEALPELHQAPLYPVAIAGALKVFPEGRRAALFEAGVQPLPDAFLARLRMLAHRRFLLVAGTLACPVNAGRRRRLTAAAGL
jgi:hypothetical protein